MVKKSRIEFTEEYNKDYWEMMDSKKSYEMVSKKENPKLKLFFKGIYERKRKELKAKWY